MIMQTTGTNAAPAQASPMIKSVCRPSGSTVGEPGEVKDCSVVMIGGGTRRETEMMLERSPALLSSVPGPNRKRVDRIGMIIFKSRESHDDRFLGAGCGDMRDISTQNIFFTDFWVDGEVRAEFGEVPRVA